MPGAIMANLKLKYVKRYRDGSGITRHYFRRKGYASTPLPGAVGSPEFMEAYQNCLGAKAPPQGKAPGTFGRIITDYYRTAHFTNLKPNSQSLYRQALEPLGAKHGHKPARLLDEDAVIDMIEAIGERAPQMANLTRGVLLKVLKVAYGRKWIPRPISGQEITKYKGGTHHTWTQEELDAYEARWPLGTRERLAYALLLYTGQRGGDAVRMTRREALAGSFSVVQEKTDTPLKLPIHPDLLEAIKASPANGMTVIGDRNGRPIKRRTLTKLIKKAAKAAGLPAYCVPHGIRKSTLTRMAENGASDKELASVSGHKSAKEISRYTAAARQEVMARGAMDRMTIKRTPGV